MIEAFVAVATVAHSLIMRSDEINLDPDFDDGKKPSIVSASEQLMSKLKDLSETTKMAARMFPSEQHLNDLKTKSIEYLKAIKELVTLVQS